MNVLAIRFSSLGDILLTLPALATLRSRVPEARVRFVTRRPFVGLLELSPLIETIEPFDEQSGLLDLVRRVRCGPVDLVLDLHSSLRSRLLTLLIGRRAWRTPTTHLRRRRMLGGRVRRSLEPVWKAHCRTVLTMLEAAGVSTGHLPEAPGGAATVEPVVGPLLRAPEEARGRVASAVGPERRVVALVPGARWPTKRWPLQRFVAVGRALAAAGRVPVVIGSPEEGGLISAVVSAVGRPAVACTGGWAEIVAWLERCEGAVGNDSGLTHLAEALGRPVVALFGPTVPELGFAPRLAASRGVGTALPCRPCSLHGGARCPLEHHACMTEIRPERVIEAMSGWRSDGGA